MQTIRLPSGAFEFDPATPLGPPGGFGQVFMGKSADGSSVAIKKLHLSASAAAHRELDIARELQGAKFQYVIGFIDAGVDADTGGYFVVMARAEFSLRQELVRKGKFNVAQAADVLLQIASGLVEVSSIVHRDLKPDNILWHENRWKIADFGIARFVEDATSAQTLKGCLSPLYAAPEQWRYERATNATDIYSLSCIAHELLTGLPPFTRDHERQHQTEQLPAFECTDPRLSGLISLMARKPAQARPSITRTQTVLREIVSSPASSKISSLTELAAAGAIIAAATQKAEAEKAAAARAQYEREQLHIVAQQMLAENIGRLWERIHLNAPAAQHLNFRKNPCQAQILLGTAIFEVGQGISNAVAPNQFAHSQWDVVSYSTFTVRNGGNQQYCWAEALWYAKLPNTSDFRWIEVGYFSPFAQRTSPFFPNGYREADLAASPITSGVSIGWGPKPIDGEDEHDFHERCIWLLAKAANGQLREPRSMPIHNWPPQM